MTNIKEIYDQPLLKLLSDAHSVHKAHHDPSRVQVCHLISVKTGGCIENCTYCAQSIHNPTGLKAFFLSEKEVIEKAIKAKEMGATRVCLGCAWRSPPKGIVFEKILSMITAIKKAVDIEICCTMGMLSSEQAESLKQAGTYAYNHNLDTSRSFYPKVTTTRNYDDRLTTLDIVQKAGLSVCSGGILGLGEDKSDRIALLQELKNLKKEPDSIPVNLLFRVRNTPLENQPEVPFWEVIRFIAVTRIVFPRAMVRLTAGRDRLSEEQHALCFLAGVNSLFIGEKYLTIKNHTVSWDEKLFECLGINQ